MNIDILTLFPCMFRGPFDESIIKRAKKNKLVRINIHNLRDWAKDKHKTTAPATQDELARRCGRVDDKPYGGGAGMVLKVDVIDQALYDLKIKIQNSDLQSNSNVLKLKLQNQFTHVVLLTPQGKQFNQKIAKKLSKKEELVLICGHYEGFDERIRSLVDEEISIGPYVLTGGEIPAMVLVDSIVRLSPGVLGKNESSQEESFSMDNFIKNHYNLKLKTLPTGRQVKNLNLSAKGWLEYPQYTRPEKYLPISKKYKKIQSVPKILLSGNHQKIANWRLEQVIKKSKRVLK